VSDGSSTVRIKRVTEPVAVEVLRRLVKINAVSFLAQIVQIGTVPALIALRLNAAHYSPLTVGMVAGAPWLAILLLGGWAPSILRRHGFVNTNRMALALSVFALCGALPATAPATLFIANFVFGVGLILRWVACDTWIVSVAPESIRGRAIGTHETLMGCGIAAGPLLILLTGFDGALPLLSCIALLLCSGAVLFTLGDCNGYPEATNRSQRLAVVRVVPTALMAGFVAGAVETSSISFLPVLSEHHLFALGVTAVLAGFGTGGTVLQIPLGWLADKTGFRRAQLITAIVVAACALALPMVAHLPVLLFALLFVWGGAAGGMNTLAVIEVGQRISGAGMSTGLLAVALAYTVGSVSGPVLTGWVTGLFPDRGLSIVVAVSVAAFVAVWAATALRVPQLQFKGATVSRQ
jgi:MFS family permease